MQFPNSFSEVTLTARLVVGDNGETCPYPWHLGTNPLIASQFVEEIFHKYILAPARIREVQLCRGNEPKFSYNGVGWSEVTA